MAKAPVFPEPVCAKPMTSFPGAVQEQIVVIRGGKQRCGNPPEAQGLYRYCGTSRQVAEASRTCECLRYGLLLNLCWALPAQRECCLGELFAHSELFEGLHRGHFGEKLKQQSSSSLVCVAEK